MRLDLGSFLIAVAFIAVAAFGGICLAWRVATCVLAAVVVVVVCNCCCCISLIYDY